MLTICYIENPTGIASFANLPTLEDFRAMFPEDTYTIEHVFDTTLDIKNADAHFANHAYEYGLSPSDYRRVFKDKHGDRYEIVAIRPQNYKYPIIYKNLETDKRYKCSVPAITRLLKESPI